MKNNQNKTKAKAIAADDTDAMRHILAPAAEYIDTVNGNGHTLLYKALKNKYSKLAVVLIRDFNANLDAHSDITILRTMIDADKIELFKQLCEKGFSYKGEDINTLDQHKVYEENKEEEFQESKATCQTPK